MGSKGPFVCPSPSRPVCKCVGICPCCQRVYSSPSHLLLLDKLVYACPRNGVALQPETVPKSPYLALRLWVSSNLQPLASRSICTDEQPASLILMPLQGPPCVTESPTTTHIVVHLWPVCISVDVCWHRFRARSKRAYNRARGLICSQVCLRRACPLSQIHTGEGFPHSTYKYLGTVKVKKLGIS